MQNPLRQAFPTQQQSLVQYQRASSKPVFVIPALFMLILSISMPAEADENLPVLGDSNPGAVSLDQEYRIGRAWLRSLRAQANLLDDPQIYLFVTSVLDRLAGFSALPERRLSVVLLNNSSLNAFAAPGGIVGINSGLFLFARDEGEFASVLAHELAHLSQRHYARGVEEQQASLPLRLAATLASILVAANSNAQAGTAAIASTQAVFADRSLAFSRQNEQEADRIGMQVLAQTGYEPAAMPAMFSQMQRAARFAGAKTPEFLLTHPVTESRIADAMNRANQMAPLGQRDSELFRIMQARAKVLSSRSISEAQTHYASERLRNPSAANRYGFAFSALLNRQYDVAKDAILELINQSPGNLSYRLLEAEWLSQTNPSEAQQALDRLRTLYPNHLAVDRLLAQALQKQGETRKQALLLANLVRHYPEDLQLWKELADAWGQSGDRLHYFRAMAEYHLLRGAVDDAEQQLRLAIKLTEVSDTERARITLRLKDAAQIRRDMDF